MPLPAWAKETAWREWVWTTALMPPKAWNRRRCVAVSDDGRKLALDLFALQIQDDDVGRRRGARNRRRSA